MKTDYYCDECDFYFSEQKLPNMNKRHDCGRFLKILKFYEKENPEGEGK